MTIEYVCEHGWRSPMPFTHELGPTTSAGDVPPVPLCYPVEQERKADGRKPSPDRENGSER